MSMPPSQTMSFKYAEPPTISSMIICERVFRGPRMVLLLAFPLKQVQKNSNPRAADKSGFLRRVSRSIWTCCSFQCIHAPNGPTIGANGLDNVLHTHVEAQEQKRSARTKKIRQLWVTDLSDQQYEPEYLP